MIVFPRGLGGDLKKYRVGKKIAVDGDLENTI